MPILEVPARPLPPPYHRTPELAVDSQGSVCRPEDAVGLATSLINQE